MAFKAILLLILATILFVTSTRASSHDVHEELKSKQAAYVQSKAPPPLPIVKSPAPPPLVTKAPAPPPAKTPAPPPKVIKAPTPAPPLVKPPVIPVKPPTYAPPPKVIKGPTPAPPLVKPPVSPAPPAKPPTYAPPPLPPVKSKKDCIPLCAYRCQKHSRKNLCMRACNTCCERCKCVPPGTSGNRERCGKCYTEMTTRRNQRKCP